MIIPRCWHHWHLLLVAGVLNISGIAFAQQPPSPAAEQEGRSRAATDIVVTGTRVRGSAIGNVNPVAVIDQNAIKTLGATSLSELLKRVKGLTTSDSGNAPAFLLNGRRTSGFGELQSLPPEAMERIEVLPEQEAARFGFPPTVRVMNFITKKRFRALALQELVGTTTEGGGATNYIEAVSTRIDDERRTSLTVSHLRQNPILQSQRGLAPDPDTLFAFGGNVTGIGGASIDRALDVLAGRAITVAAVPSDPSARRSLASYVATANTPSITNIGRYRSLVQRSDTVRVDGTVASPISRATNGSINLTMEAQHGAGLNGLASGVLTVPIGGMLPFSNDVLLYRYFPGSALRQRTDSLSLHAGGILHGGINRWTWNVNGTYDRVLNRAYSENGLSLIPLQTAVNAGGDPFAQIGPATPSLQAISRSRTVVGTLGYKMVANGPLFRLPAGDVLVTASVDYARSTSRSSEPGALGHILPLGRTTTGISINVDVPIASDERHALSFLGNLTANGMFGVSEVSNYGRLTTFNYGMAWAPTRQVQFAASINETPTPPAIGLLSSPKFTVPNTPFFDFTTGASVLVTTVSGGNPALLPERRRVTTVSVTLIPVKGEELRFNFNYVDARIANQTASFVGATTGFQAAFPERFVRNTSGQLILVDLRLVNLAIEQEQKIRFSLESWAQFGKTINTLNKGKSNFLLRPQVNVFTNLSATLRLSDRLMIEPNTASLNLLDGAILNGAGGRPRWELEGSVSSSYGPVNISLYGQFQSASRVKSEIASSDLQFSNRTFLVFLGSLDIGSIMPRVWTNRLSMQISADNVLNSRISVHDRNGLVPSRFQTSYTDPLGRVVRIGIRKIF